MPFPEFDPVLIHLGPLPIRWYALAYVAGIVLGWWYASKLIKTERLWAPARPPLTPNQLDDLVLWIVLGIILGGRLGYVLERVETSTRPRRAYFPGDVLHLHLEMRMRRHNGRVAHNDV